MALIFDLGERQRVAIFRQNDLVHRGNSLQYIVALIIGGVLDARLGVIRRDSCQLISVNREGASIEC